MVTSGGLWARRHCGLRHLARAALCITVRFSRVLYMPTSPLGREANKRFSHTGKRSDRKAGNFRCYLATGAICY